MLWEVMLEMLAELFAVSGEILGTFWKIGKELKDVGKKKDKDGKPVPNLDGDKKSGQMVLIIAIVGLISLLALQFPGVRHMVVERVHGGGQAITDLPRNDFPMAQYTTPELFKKRKYTIDEDGWSHSMYYYWYAPPAAQGEKLPLVVVLHGKDGMDQAAMYLRMGAVQKAFPSYILIPQSPAGKIWDAPAAYTGQEFANAAQLQQPPEELRSLKDVIILLAQLTQYVAIDENRLYIIGCDEGADGVYGAAVDFPGVFAAGVALAGKWSFADRGKFGKTPLLIMQGAADEVIPAQFAGTFTQVVKQAGGNVAYYEFPGLTHDCNAPVFYSMAVWKWMFAHRRVPAPVVPAASVAGQETAPTP